jgi:hypothetical protein
MLINSFPIIKKSIHLAGLLAAFFCIGLPLHSIAQEKKQVIDTSTISVELSDFKNDSLMTELRSLLDSMSKQQSFFSFYASVSNRLFSAKNNAFNSQQSNTSVTAFTPSLSYFHKTGLGLSATSYLRAIDGKFSLYQTAISPSFDKIEKKLMYGVSYSYYLKNKSIESTPYNHEVYAYLQGRKTWLRPSLAIGWAKGGYSDVSSIPIKVNGNYRWIMDSTYISLSDLSLSAGVSHSFILNNVITKNDAFTFVPQLSLITGRQSFITTSKITLPGIPEREVNDDRIRKIYKLLSPSSTSGAQFSLQTLAFSSNITYIKNAISLSAGYFAGYYFNNTNGDKLSHIFNISVGLTF